MNQDSKFEALVSPRPSTIEQQLRSLAQRQMPMPGKKQVDFTAAEVLLCLAASRVVKWNSYGGKNAHLAPPPVPQLAHLFKRSPGSVTSKMGNLFGGRAHQGKSETDAAEWYLEDPTRLLSVYGDIIHVARQQAIGPHELPDFLPRDPSQWAPW